MTRPRVLVARAVFPDVVERLRAHFDVEDNPADTIYTPAELSAHLQGRQGAFTAGSDRIDAALLDAHPQLRVVCNMAVGYNNIDVAACTARGVLATNTPEVLTETTADFGFALMMATARRITESEHFLRRGAWTKWSYDMFSGCDVHGATLGILGMGRIGQAIARRTKRSLSAMRRAVAIISAKPKSAVVSVSTSGVLVASTPAAVQAAMSKLL
jgi:gluconate 2-dehydrogenase